MKPAKYILMLLILALALGACQTQSLTPEAENEPEAGLAQTEPASPATQTPEETLVPTFTPTLEATLIPTETTPVLLPPEPIEVNFEASDGQALTGTYFPADENPAPIIVLFPWAQGNQSEWEEVAYWLQGRGLLVPVQDARRTWKSSNWYPERTLNMPLGVFTFNFRSCEAVDGCTSYLPVEWLLDAQAAIETAAGLQGADPEQVLAVGASIGADGAATSCAWLSSSAVGKCRGIFALSPFSSLTIDFRQSADVILNQQDPGPVYCLYGLKDDAAVETCGDYPQIRALNFGYTDDHGLELIHVDRRPAPLNILQEFILEAVGGEE